LFKIYSGMKDKIKQLEKRVEKLEKRHEQLVSLTTALSEVIETIYKVLADESD